MTDKPYIVFKGAKAYDGGVFTCQPPMLSTTEPWMA